MAHVLLVEDDPEAVAEILARLQSAGHTCDVAGSQKEAEAFLDTNSYDLFLIDLKIPFESGGFLSEEFGRNLIDHIVLRPGHRNKPILVVTAYGIDSYHLGVEMIKRGAFDVVGKPFGPAHPFDAKVREALASKRSSREENLDQGAMHPFQDGTLDFFPERVELKGIKIAGPEGSSHRRKLLDFLKDRHLAGDAGPHSGAAIGGRLGFARGEDAVNEASRQIRDTCTREMAKKHQTACGRNDVIHNEDSGYRFGSKIKVRVHPGEADEENALETPNQEAILRELKSGKAIPAKELRSRFPLSPRAFAQEMAPLEYRGLVAREGNGAATRYRLATRPGSVSG